MGYMNLFCFGSSHLREGENMPTNIAAVFEKKHRGSKAI
jgi:hypothetical protein